MNTDPKSMLDTLMKALEAEGVPEKHRVRDCVAQAFDALEQSMQRKIKPERILELFNESYGLTLTLPTFRRHLREERERRNPTSSPSAVGERAA